jgi:hypothetical protein
LVWVLVVVNLLSTGPSWELKGVFETSEACQVLLEKIKKDNAGVNGEDYHNGEFAVNTTAFCIQTDKVDKEDVPDAK